MKLKMIVLEQMGSCLGVPPQEDLMRDFITVFKGRVCDKSLVCAGLALP